MAAHQTDNALAMVASAIMGHHDCRQELSRLGTCVVLDERDAEQLALLEEQDAEQQSNAGSAGGAAQVAGAAGSSSEPGTPRSSGSGSGVGAPSRRMAMGEAVRLQTTDNFQGEESLVIIGSLVRSNRWARFVLCQCRIHPYKEGQPALSVGFWRVALSWATLAAETLLGLGASSRSVGLHIVPQPGLEGS